MRRLVPVLAALLVAAPALSEPFAARDTAKVGNKWDYSIGVFAPLTLGIADGLELRTHPLSFFVYPNLDVRKSHWESGLWKVAGEYGVTVPTPVLKLAQSYLFPIEGKVGWFVVPHVGAVASRGDLDANVLSVSADLAIGIPLTRSDVRPMGNLPLVELELAPMFPGEVPGTPAGSSTENRLGYRFRFGGIYDYRLSDAFRLRGYADIFVHGANPSPWTLRAGAAVELRVGKMSRLSAGALWWNSDQQALDRQTWQHVRSNDFLPTLDFIWAG